MYILFSQQNFLPRIFIPEQSWLTVIFHLYCVYNHEFYIYYITLYMSDNIIYGLWYLCHTFNSWNWIIFILLQLHWYVYGYVHIYSLFGPYGNWAEPPAVVIILYGQWGLIKYYFHIQFDPSYRYIHYTLFNIT